MKVTNPTTPTTAALVALIHATENAARVVHSSRLELRRSACDKLADAAIDLHNRVVQDGHSLPLTRDDKAAIMRDLALVFGQVDLDGDQLQLAVNVCRDLGEALGVTAGPTVAYHVVSSDDLGDDLLGLLGYGAWVTVQVWDLEADTANVIHWNAAAFGQPANPVPFLYHSRQAAWADADDRAEGDWSDLDAAAAERAADPHGVFL